MKCPKCKAYIPMTRSEASHRHYFAAIREAYNNLPERVTMEWWTQSAEHLRKYALIKTGHCDRSVLHLASPDACLAAAIQLRQRDKYSEVTIQDNMLSWSTAHSQQLNAMGKKDFERSKEDVLGFLAGLLEVSKQHLLDASEQHAI